MIYAKIGKDSKEVYIKNGSNGKWRRVRDEAMASTVHSWIVDASNRM